VVKNKLFTNEVHASEILGATTNYPGAMWYPEFLGP